MALSAGKVFIDVLANMSHFQKDVSSGLSKASKDFEKKTADLSKTLTRSLTLPLVALGTAAFNAASDLSESMSKVDVVFGSSADEVIAWSKTSVDAMGMSQQAALEAAGTYGNLFQAFGVTREEATKMSTELVQLASDLASFNNTSMDEALVALRSGLSGETEPLKRYGIAINDVRLKNEAMAMGLITSTKEALNPAAKAQAAYALIMKDSVLAQGDFARTSDGAANTLRRLKARLQDTLAALGEKLIPLVIDGANAIMGMVDSFNRMSPLMQDLVLKFLVLLTVIGPLMKLVPLILGIARGVIFLVTALDAYVAASGAAAAASAGMTAAMGASSAAILGWIGLAILFGIAVYKVAKWLGELGGPEALPTDLQEGLLKVRDNANSATDSIQKMTHWITDEFNDEAKTGISDFTAGLEQMELAFKAGEISGEEAAGVINALAREAGKAGVDGTKFVNVWVDQMARAAVATDEWGNAVYQFANMSMEELDDWVKDLDEKFNAAEEVFNNLSDKAKVTVDEIIAEYQRLLEDRINFNENILTLQARGLNDEVLQLLITEGPEAAATYAAALVRATDADLTRINDLGSAYEDASDSLADQLVANGEEWAKWARKVNWTIDAVRSYIYDLNNLTLKGTITLQLSNQLTRNFREGIIPQFASGGVVTQPTLGLVGEAGPEAIIPLSQLSSMSSGGELTITDWRRGIATLSRELDHSAYIRGE